MCKRKRRRRRADTAGLLPGIKHDADGKDGRTENVDRKG
jgi:hypothetical protein